MFETRKIRKLIELVKETGIGELEVKSGEESVRISTKTQVVTTPIPTTHHLPSATEAAATTEQAEAKPKLPEGHSVKSPMVGTVYLAASPGSDPFVSIGQHVEVGETLCLIEAMKMFNKIEADKSGVVSARLIENEQPVEYDQALFILDTGE